MIRVVSIYAASQAKISNTSIADSFVVPLNFILEPAPILSQFIVPVGFVPLKHKVSDPLSGLEVLLLLEIYTSTEVKYSSYKKTDST